MLILHYSACMSGCKSQVKDRVARYVQVASVLYYRPFVTKKVSGDWTLIFIFKGMWYLRKVAISFEQFLHVSVRSLNLNQSNFHWLNQWFAFSLNHQWKQYFPLLNQFIFTEVISEIWLFRSNLFLAIWISQISLIISRFLLIHI